MVGCRVVNKGGFEKRGGLQTRGSTPWGHVLYITQHLAQSGSMKNLACWHTLNENDKNWSKVHTLQIYHLDIPWFDSCNFSCMASDTLDAATALTGTCMVSAIHFCRLLRQTKPFSSKLDDAQAKR